MNVQLVSFAGHRVNDARTSPRVLSDEVVKAGAIDFGNRRLGDNLHSYREQDHPFPLPFVEGIDLMEGFVEANFTKVGRKTSGLPTVYVY